MWLTISFLHYQHIIMNSFNIDIRKHLTHLIEYQLIICISCKYVFWFNEIQTHFQEKHHNWFLQRALTLQHIVQSWLEVFQYSIDLKIFKRINIVIDALKSSVDDLFCQFDSECHYCCITPRIFFKHLSVAHEWTQHARKDQLSATASRKEQSWIQIHCQRFFDNRQEFQYFVVEQITSEINFRQSQSVISVWNQANAFVIQVWDIAKQKEAQMIVENQINEINSWLKRTQWHTYLNDLNRFKVNEIIFRSDSTAEFAIDKIWIITKSMIQHCHIILSVHVDHFARMKTMRTEKHQTKFHSLQFNQNFQSFDNYIRAWQHLLMFFQRVSNNKTRRLSDDLKKMLKYRFIKRQKIIWQSFKKTIRRDLRSSQHLFVSQFDIINDFIADSSTNDETQLNIFEQTCLNFCIALLNHQINKHEYESSLICALIVLNIHQTQWIKSNKYSSILFAVIKISRMMIIQQVCLRNDFFSSFSDFSENDFNQNLNHSQFKKNLMLQVIKDMMNKFMIRDTHDFMQWMLNLRTYELKIQFNTIFENHVNWIENEIMYKQVQFNMSNFREMFHDFVTRIERLLFDELLFNRTKSNLNVESFFKIFWSKFRNNFVDEQNEWNFF